MEQDRLASFLEALANTLIGYVVAPVSQLTIFPWVGIHVPLSTNVEIGLWFTLVSVVRSYALRRWFNARIKRATQAAAAKMGCV